MIISRKRCKTETLYNTPLIGRRYIQWPWMTFIVSRLMQSFSTAILRDAVQQMTTFILTERRAVPLWHELLGLRNAMIWRHPRHTKFLHIASARHLRNAYMTIWICCVDNETYVFSRRKNGHPRELMLLLCEDRFPFHLEIKSPENVHWRSEEVIYEENKNKPAQNVMVFSFR